MRLRKFWKERKKKNPFEASMPLDKPEIKVVEARYDDKPFFIGIGVAKQRDVKGAGGVGTEGVKGEFQSQKNLDWQVLYNLNALPKGFVPEERLKDWMAGTVSAVSGSVDVFQPRTEFIETKEEKLKEVKSDEWWTHDPELGKLDNMLAMIEREKKKQKKA